MDMLGKITLKDIGCKGELAGALPNNGDKIALARIYGVASGLKVKEDKRTNSFHTAIQGNFRALVLQTGVETTGKVFSSGLLYLPSGLQDLLEAQLNTGDDDVEVTFAFDVFAYKVDRPGAKYSYGGAVLGEPAREDPLARLEATFAGVPALGAPKPEPQALKASEPEAGKGGKEKTPA